MNFVYIGSVSSMPDCLCPHHSQSESVLNVYKSHALAIMDNFHCKIVTLKTLSNYSDFFLISRWYKFLLYFLNINFWNLSQFIYVWLTIFFSPAYGGERGRQNHQFLQQDQELCPQDHGLPQLCSQWQHFR